MSWSIRGDRAVRAIPYSPVLLGVAVLIVATVAAPLPLWAQDSSTTSARMEQADALFARGRDAMAAHDYAQACSLLQDSYQLDPATGSLLALAICHEWEGKLASAFREYEQVVGSGEDQGRPDRVRAASERVAALRPALSTLTLHMDSAASSPAGRQVHIDNALVDPSMFDVPIPIDGGPHQVVVSAPQKRSFSVIVNIAPHHDNQALSIPALEAEAVARAPLVTRLRAAPIVKPIAGSAAQADAQRVRSRPYLRAAGIATLSVGVLSLVGGALMTLQDVHDNNVLNSGCSDAGCIDDPPHTPLTLRGSSSAALIAGTALAVSGTVMLIIARRAARSDESPALMITPVATARSAGAALQGHF